MKRFLHGHRRSGHDAALSRPRLLAGLRWRAVAVVVGLCALDVVRAVVPALAVGNLSFAGAPLATLEVIASMMAGRLIIGALVALAVVATYNLARRRNIVLYPALALALWIACVAGVAASMAVELRLQCPGQSIQECWGYEAQTGVVSIIAPTALRYWLLCALFALVFVYLRRADESSARADEAEAVRARLEQRMEEAHLAMLHAQIEPHFLFNTLANVRRLYQTSPADATSMMDHLMRYFAVALPQMRASDSTLGREADLTASYLAIQQIRMGRRLSFVLDIPQGLRDTRFPSMMILTLAENAVKHGLAPLTGGGEVRIEARADDARLDVRVADTGRGFAHSAGGGTGLANIRARLAGLYGAGASLSLAFNAPQGIVATISVPLVPAAQPAVSPTAHVPA
jgi:signal transduction histidine kinase